MLKSLKDDFQAMVDLGTVLTIGIAFAGLMVIAYIIWTVKDLLLLNVPTGNQTTNPTGWASYWAENTTRTSLDNITTGFDNTVGLIIVAITIFVLAIAIAALMMLRGGRD